MLLFYFHCYALIIDICLFFIHVSYARNVFTRVIAENINDLTLLFIVSYWTIGRAISYERVLKTIVLARIIDAPSTSSTEEGVE